MPNTAVAFTQAEIKLLADVDQGLVNYDNIDHELYSRLFEYFLPDMPYGTAKARTGDPHQFICDHLHELIASIPSSVLLEILE